MVTVTGTGCVLVAGVATGIVTPPMVTAWVSSRGVVRLMFSVSISFVAISIGRLFESGSKDHEKKVYLNFDLLVIIYPWFYRESRN
jgi:hypothetical protein